MTASAVRSDAHLTNVKPSARVKLAVRLYQTGACRTKKEASIAAGLHPNYLTMLTRQGGGSEPVKRLMNDVDDMIADQTVQTSAIIELLGRRAVGKLANLMESANEGVVFKAAQDLADRSPATSKTQKVQLDSFSISGQDVKDLAAAMVESARSQQRYMHIANEGLDEVGLNVIPELPAHAKETETVEANADEAEPQTLRLVDGHG